MTKELNAKLLKIRLFLTDVDGVLTDGGFFINEQMETKRFDVQDGLGQRVLQHEGIKVGWISNRPSTATERRAKELRVDFLVQGKGSKVAAAKEILAQAGLSFDQVSFVGDDLVDLALLKQVGASFSVPNGVKEVKMVADYVTRAPGGHGAIREIAELILKAQNKWGAVLERFSAET